jgi:L-fuculose-phosphate aldolase
MVFACLGRTIYPLTEVTKKFGPIKPIAPVKAHSEELAAAVVEEVLSQRQELKAHALGLLIPGHGIVVVAKDLDEAYDALERMEGNARCVLFARLLGKELSPEEPLGEENPLASEQQ